MSTLRATEVFTPNTFPTYTYVPRSDQEFERNLKNAVMTPNLVVSVSGPSKSGKSVLLQKVVGSDNLIRVFGTQIKSADSLWDTVLDSRGVPSQKTSQASNSVAQSATGGAAVGFGVPGVLTVGGNSQIGKISTDVSGQLETRNRTGLTQVVQEIGNSNFVIFIDDFHYMNRELQNEVTKQIKSGAELGLKICVASVPHRSDDVVRANPELRGRVQAVDMEYWSENELIKIGDIGFPLLNLEFDLDFIKNLAKESCGSPQLMQSLCLQSCYRFDAYEKFQLQPR